jgi:hypothetical protein
MGAATHDKISISIKLGTRHVPGVDPTLGSPTEARCINTGFDIDHEQEGINVDTGCGRYVVPGAETKRYRFEQVVLLSGLFWDPSGSDVDPVGYDIEITVKPVSTLDTGRVYKGWVKKWNWTSRGNQTQAEVIEIEGMAKYAS